MVDGNGLGNGNGDSQLVIGGRSEPRYWREVISGEKSGEWVSSGQPGPPLSVVVTQKGIELYGHGIRMDRALRPGEARWFATRILEACGIYESTMGGDGTLGPNPGQTRPVTQTTSPIGERRWVCHCGAESKNAGAMSIHAKRPGHGPIRMEER